MHCQRIVTQGKHESNALSARLSGAVKVKRKDSQKMKKKKKKNAPKDKGRHTCRIDVGQNQFSVFQVLDQCVSHAW